MDSNRVDAYILLDIIFTPLADQISSTLNTNISKSTWIKTSMREGNDSYLYDSFILSALSPFAITTQGLIVKCRYMPSLEKVLYRGQDLDLIEPIAMDSQDWDWKRLVNRNTFRSKISNFYKDINTFKNLVDLYIYDNSILRNIVEEAEYEL